MTKLETRDEQAVRLLLEARRFENHTVVESSEMAAWRREVDIFVKGYFGDNWKDRYDTPDRVAARKFVDSLFSHGRPML